MADTVALPAGGSPLRAVHWYLLHWYLLHWHLLHWHLRACRR
ncbi:MAG TPA: hypothetical protein VME46_01865 [Acidimicrobiales bacterium]|nr:hypothetical protein [Acidimicrobiales bacterium]